MKTGEAASFQDADASLQLAKVWSQVKQTPLIYLLIWRATEIAQRLTCAWEIGHTRLVAVPSCSLAL